MTTDLNSLLPDLTGAHLHAIHTLAAPQSETYRIAVLFAEPTLPGEAAVM